MDREQRKNSRVLRFQIRKIPFGNAHAKVQGALRFSPSPASLILALVLASAYPAQAGSGKPGPHAAPTTPVMSAPASSGTGVSADNKPVETAKTGVKKKKTLKTFEWYFKNGCNCAQCQAQRKRMREEQEHLQNTFQP